MLACHCIADTCSIIFKAPHQPSDTVCMPLLPSLTCTLWEGQALRCAMSRSTPLGMQSRLQHWLCTQHLWAQSGGQVRGKFESGGQVRGQLRINSSPRLISCMHQRKVQTHSPIKKFTGMRVGKSVGSNETATRMEWAFHAGLLSKYIFWLGNCIVNK